MLPCAVLGGVLMAACQVLIYRYAPVEQTMGLVQKIFYTHLPLAWWSFVSFFLVCVSGVAYLKTRNRHWDAVAGAAAMIDGMVERMEQELGSSTTVVATGGIARFVLPLCRTAIHYERDLILQGLGMLYRDNVRGSTETPADK